jgi:type IX secretion system PorP/SprF family membrane protein
LLFLWAVLAHAQDPVFSQFYNAPLNLNPAMASLEKSLTFSASIRKQWTGIGSEFSTTQASLIYPLYLDRHLKPFGHFGAVGVSFYKDKNGPNGSFVSQGASLTGSYMVQLDRFLKHNLSFSLKGNYHTKSLDINALQFGSQYNSFLGHDPSIQVAENELISNVSLMDFTFGALWFYNDDEKKRRLIKAANAGISIDHINESNESLIDGREAKLPRLYKLHGATVFTTGEFTTFSLNTVLVNQASFWQANFGGYLSYYSKVARTETLISRIGTWYRYQDSFIILTEFETNRFKLGFSYDLNTGNIRTVDRLASTYEIHLTLRFDKNLPLNIRY